jgi:dUTP pyrophosphatase
MDMRQRGFEVVEDKHRQHPDAEINTPVRGDARSAGYDFFAPVDITLNPAQKTLVFTDVKAYMQDGEVLKLYPRSSLGVKKGLMLSNTVGIIDDSYYSNEGNDGNIGFALLNTSGRAIHIKQGERIVQGVFTNYLVADEDTALREERSGGFGSSGK